MGSVPGDSARRFAVLYERNYGAIYAYAARRVGGGAADEIAAETFLVAWRRFDVIPEDPLPWLYGVARNVVLRHYAAIGRQDRVRAALAHERAASSPRLQDRGAEPRLWEAWERLGVGDREVLALVAWEELSVAEAARVLGCSAPVFSVRLHRARRRFGRLLATAPLVPAELSEVR